MKRTHLNALIDGLAFIAFLLLLTTGLLLEYQLPAGSGGLHGHGHGQGTADRSIQLVWGWTRHEWGQFHYWIALTMMAVLAAHLLLHWKWIVCTLRGKPSTASGYRLILGTVGLTFSVLLSAAPLLSRTSTVSRGELRDLRSKQLELHTENANSNSQDIGEDLTAIRGSMTLQQISDATGISVDLLIATLELPPNVDRNTNAGRLMRRHGLSMSDLRKAIDSSRRRMTRPNK